MHLVKILTLQLATWGFMSVPVLLLWDQIRKLRAEWESASGPKVNSHWIGKVRSAKYRAWLGQLFILIGNLVIFGAVEREIRVSGFRYIPIIYFFVATFIQGQITFSLEKALRGLQVTQRRATWVAGRQLGTFGLIYFIYINILLGVAGVLYVGARLAEERMGMQGLSDLAIGLGSPLGVFVGLAVIYSLAPVFVKWMFPTRKLKVRDPLYVKISTWLKPLGLRRVPISMIELEDFRWYNALVSGFKLPFQIEALRPTLFVSRSLVNLLTEEELKAVIYHEASHLLLGHMRKRFLWAFTLVLLSIIPVYSYLKFVELVWGDNANSVAWIGSLVVALAFQLFFFRKQVRAQELEADAHAVVGLGASFEAFASALMKLDLATGQSHTRKDPMSKLNPAAAHPTTAERIRALSSSDIRPKRRKKSVPA